MVENSDGMNQISRIAAEKMADRNTPFVFQCWYVAAFSDEIGRHLLNRTILGKRIVFFRTETGEPIALDDRCIHRSFPLSSSLLEGDTIVCRYHGMRYGHTGQCIELPGHLKPGRNIGVRAYPLVEQGPLIWIWMGDGEPDGTKIPKVSNWVGSPDWASSRQYLPLQANYIAMHENLLDLTHLSYLHATTLGTPDYAKTPFKDVSEAAKGYFALTREVIPTRLPAIWAKPTKLEGIDAARLVLSEFQTPALHVVYVRLYGLDKPEAERSIFEVRTAHFITPETPSSTHYMAYTARNFSQDDGSITEFMKKNLTAVFEEDRVGLEAVEAMVSNTAQDEFFELSFLTDRVNVAMRRYLKNCVAAEIAKKE